MVHSPLPAPSLRGEGDSSPGWEDREERQDLLQPQQPSLLTGVTPCGCRHLPQRPLRAPFTLSPPASVSAVGCSPRDRTGGSQGLDCEHHADSLREGFARPPPAPSPKTTQRQDLRSSRLRPSVPGARDGGSRPPSTAVTGSLPEDTGR